jgi:phosphoglycerate dehydrogenase-like enzyme
VYPGSAIVLAPANAFLHPRAAAAILPLSMNRLKIFSDSPLTERATSLLVEGVAPHDIIFPGQVSASVLREAAPDPALTGADIAFGQPQVAGILASTSLRWVHITSAGFTRYDTPEFRAAVAARGLQVTNSSSVYARPCAEHTLSFMLAQSRGLPRALATSCPNGSNLWNQLRENAVSLHDQSVLILGYGSIAAELIRVRITALRRNPRGDEPVPIVTPANLAAALAESDHVVNVLPDNAGTRRWMSGPQFGAMKAGAVFYNIGRGATVDQDALLAALRSGRLGAAWLDVTDPEPLPANHPLWSEPRCFITPHIAGGHRNEAESLVRHFLGNFRNYLEHGPLRDRIM